MEDLKVVNGFSVVLIIQINTFNNYLMELIPVSTKISCLWVILMQMLRKQICICSVVNLN